jgi:hypothetical protein
MKIRGAVATSALDAELASEFDHLAAFHLAQPTHTS